MLSSSALVLSAAVATGTPFRTGDEPDAAALAALVPRSAHAESPGGLLAVLRRGVPTFVQPFGLADLEHGEPVTEGTVFYVASVAKEFTAACVLHAASSGTLALDRPLPLAGLPEGFDALTPELLIEHRGGVPDVYDLAIGLDLGRDVLASNESVLALLARLGRLDFAPGTRLRYSNSGYVLLAETLRSATGSTLPAYARAHLFGPLGMESARFTGEPELADLPRAKSYCRSGETWEALASPTGLLGPGGLWAGLHDLARWERSAFEGGFGTEALRERLATPPGHASAWHPALGAYGAGVAFVDDRGLALVRSAGEAFGFQAEILRYPEQELTIVVLANADLGLDGLAEEAAAVVLRAELSAARGAGAVPGTPTAAELARYGRFWREEDTGVPWVLALAPGRMQATSLGDWRIALAPGGPSRLVARDARAPAELLFEPTEGPATRMVVRCAGVEVARCRPHPFPPSEPPDLAACAGEYVLPALGAVLRLRAGPRGLELVQERALGPEYVLPPFQPLGADLFVCDAGASLQFRRDEHARVTGVRLDMNRASGLILERR